LGVDFTVGVGLAVFELVFEFVDPTLAFALELAFAFAFALLLLFGLE
jgi:hypothetical protein